MTPLTALQGLASVARSDAYVTAHRVPTLGGLVGVALIPGEGVVFVADDAPPPRQRHEDEAGEFFTLALPRRGGLPAVVRRPRRVRPGVPRARRHRPPGRPCFPLELQGHPAGTTAAGPPVTPTPGAPPQGNHHAPADYGTAGSGNDTDETMGDQA